jgi:hypothetical protein
MERNADFLMSLDIESKDSRKLAEFCLTKLAALGYDARQMPKAKEISEVTILNYYTYTLITGLLGYKNRADLVSRSFMQARVRPSIELTDETEELICALAAARGRGPLSVGELVVLGMSNGPYLGAIAKIIEVHDAYVVVEWLTSTAISTWFLPEQLRRITPEDILMFYGYYIDSKKSIKKKPRTSLGTPAPITDGILSKVEKLVGWRMTRPYPGAPAFEPGDGSVHIPVDDPRVCDIKPDKYPDFFEPVYRKAVFDLPVGADGSLARVIPKQSIAMNGTRVMAHHIAKLLTDTTMYPSLDITATEFTIGGIKGVTREQLKKILEVYNGN